MSDAGQSLTDDGARALPGGLGGTVAHWLGAQLLAERERWVLWLPVLMGIGIGVYFWLPREPARWLGPALAAAAAVGVLIAWRGNRPLIAPLAFLALTLGFAAAQVQTWRVAAPVLQHRLRFVTVEGRLTAVDPLPEGARLVIAPSHIDRLDDGALPARVRVRLRRGAEGMVPGEWLRLRATLLPPPPPAMPGAYDFQRRAWFDRIGAVGFAMGAPQRMAPPAGEGPSWWRLEIEALRTRVTQHIRAVLPDRTGAIAAALIAGETHAIPPADAGAFRDAGLAHILVIAGLHMGMVAGICFFALRAFFALVPAIALRFHTKKWAAALALALTFFYMLLSGATVSSRRAFVMTGLVLLAVLVDRLSQSARAVAYAAVVIMLMTPESAAGPSFQMSFAAVAALVAFYEALRPRLAQWHAHAGAPRRAALYVVGITLTTIVTTVATMPFTIYHFNRFPLYSIAANALAVPITGFWVMPWAIVSCLLMPLGLEAPALHAMSWGIAAIAAIAHAVTSWPGAILTVPSMPASALVLISIGGAWLCIWRRHWRCLGLAPMLLGFSTLILVRPPDLLVSADSRLVAVRAPDGAYLPSKKRTEKLAQETWTRRAATIMGAPWPVDGAAAGGALRCDAAGCLYEMHGQTVALIRDGAALAEDCAEADLVVSPVAAHHACRGPQVIDRNDTWRNGGHAVWLDGDGIRVETVRAWQGDRPWSSRRGGD